MSQTIKEYARQFLPELSEKDARFRLQITQKMKERVEQLRGSSTFTEFVTQALNTVLFLEINPRQLHLLLGTDIKVKGRHILRDLENYKATGENPMVSTNLVLPTWRKELANYFADLLEVSLAHYIRRAVEIRIEAYSIVMENGGITSPDLVFGLPFSVGDEEYLIIT